MQFVARGVGLHCYSIFFSLYVVQITLTLTVEYCRMMRVIFLFFLLAIEVAFWGTGKPSPWLTTSQKRSTTTTTTTHTHTHTFVVENCFANLVPKTKLSVFDFSTIFLVLPELILDKKENSDSCFLGKFLCWFELLGWIGCLNCFVNC